MTDETVRVKTPDGYRNFPAYREVMDLNDDNPFTAPIRMAGGGATPYADGWTFSRTVQGEWHGFRTA